MKKYNHLLSVLLVPAMILQAGGTTTCAGGGGGTIAPTVTLPASLTGIETFNYSTATLYNLAVSTVSSNGTAFTAGTTYSAWCANPAGIVPGGGTLPGTPPTVVGPEDPSNSPTGLATYSTIENTYSISGSGGANLGIPGFTYSINLAGVGSYTTTQLTLAEEWAAVNWILNNLAGSSNETPTTSDIQGAIWQLLYSPYGQNVYTINAPSPLTSASYALYQDALAHTNFIPTTGQVVGILLIPNTPAATKGTYQAVIIPVPVVCTTAPGSATLTKTSTVNSSGANAFELVTYTYTIKNTGTTTLGNLNIVDDNGTPNYTGDDYTLPIPSTVTIAPGSSYSISTQVYLPISLFYQSGDKAAFDTLIPQIVPAASAGAKASLLLTYLIDTDVTDNTYGTGASAAWKDNGGHTFGEIESGYAEFAFYNSIGQTVADFDVNYLKNLGVSTTNSSGYNSSLGSIITNNSYLTSSNGFSLDSTLADNLNNFPLANDTLNSPAAGTDSWDVTAGYKVLLNEGAFGMFGSSFSAVVKKNYLAATETGFSGKCGSPQGATYTPCIYGNVINSTAYLCANVCGCSTIVHAKACLSVKVCGATQPTCNNPGGHICQQPVHCGCTCAQCQAGNHGKCTAPVKCKPPVCTCPCAQCQAGNHGGCTHVGCTDPICHANSCNHNTVKCVVANKPTTYCW